MIEVSVVYSDEKQIEKVREFNFIDIGTKRGRKEGWALKNYWGSKLDPFAIVIKGNKPIKAFYSESIDVPEALIQYLKERQYE